MASTRKYNISLEEMQLFVVPHKLYLMDLVEKR